MPTFVIFRTQEGLSSSILRCLWRLPFWIVVVQAKDQATGIEIDGRRIRVDFSITERAHTPTPGIYLGKPTRLVAV